MTTLERIKSPRIITTSEIELPAEQSDLQISFIVTNFLDKYLKS